MVCPPPSARSPIAALVSSKSFQALHLRGDQVEAHRTGDRRLQPRAEASDRLEAERCGQPFNECAMRRASAVRSSNKCLAGVTHVFGMVAGKGAEQRAVGTFATAQQMQAARGIEPGNARTRLITLRSTGASGPKAPAVCRACRPLAVRAASAAGRSRVRPGSHRRLGEVIVHAGIERAALPVVGVKALAVMARIGSRRRSGSWRIACVAAMPSMTGICMSIGTAA